MEATLNRKDAVLLKAVLDTVFSPHDPNRADLTGTPQIHSVDVNANPPGEYYTLMVDFTVNNVGYVFHYDYEDEQAEGYRTRDDDPESDPESDPDPDWESSTPDMGLALLAFIAAIKDGLIK